MTLGEPPAPFPRRTLLTIGAFLAALVYIAYFRRFTEFGFYSDDHAFFGGLINRDWKSEIDDVWFCLTKWPQGRPLGLGLNLNLLPYVVFHFAGLSGLYGAAFIIVTANCTLLYRLVSQFHPPVVALSAAGFYALAPADTVQISLVYAYNFEIAVLFGLLSAMAALRGRPVWFAAALAGTVLMVEPVAMFALFVPLIFTVRRDRAWLFWAARHVAIWSGVILAVLVARRLIGDPWGSERVSEIAAKPWAVFQSGLTSAFTGFRTHFELARERLIQPLREADTGLWQVMLGAGAVTGVLVWLAWPREQQGSGLAAKGFGWWPGGRLLLAGSTTMLAVYFCYYRDPWYPANARTGFMSGVHVIAAAGSCLVFAGLMSLLVAALPRRFHPALGALLVLVFASLAGFGNLIQRDYANSWAFQRKFWNAYARLCRDATDETFVLVLDRNLPPLRYTDLFSWGSEILPPALFEYRNAPLDGDHTGLGDKPGTASAPAARLLQRPPVVIHTAPEAVTAIKFADQQYTWKPTYYFMLPKTPAEQPKAGNVIVLTYSAQGTWDRISGEVAVDGGKLQLRPAGGEDLLDRLRKTPLAPVYGL